MLFPRLYFRSIILLCIYFVPLVPYTIEYTHVHMIASSFMASKTYESFCCRRALNLTSSSCRIRMGEYAPSVTR